MIPPRQQWCIQIDVTNACGRGCSNCTRLTSHARQPFFMDAPTFERACRALAAFPEESEPDRKGRRKVVGVIGGEPLAHPDFPQLVNLMRRIIPEPSYRGLWTGLHWPSHKHAGAVEHLLGGRPSATTTVAPVRRGAMGYLNWNPHVDPPCLHQPVLVAIEEVIRDEQQMWRLIDRCPLQEDWSATITPKGFFFCEVAGAMDMIFGGPGGLPITPGCWCHDLADYRDQIERWCPRCGVCLPLVGRLDREGMDDVTEANLEALRQVGSPRALAGDVVLYDAGRLADRNGWQPLRYMRGE